MILTRVIESAAKAIWEDQQNRLNDPGPITASLTWRSKRVPDIFWEGYVNDAKACIEAAIQSGYLVIATSTQEQKATVLEDAIEHNSTTRVVDQIFLQHCNELIQRDHTESSTHNNKSKSEKQVDTTCSDKRHKHQSVR